MFWASRCWERASWASWFVTLGQDGSDTATGAIKSAQNRIGPFTVQAGVRLHAVCEFVRRDVIGTRLERDAAKSQSRYCSADDFDFICTHFSIDIRNGLIDSLRNEVWSGFTPSNHLQQIGVSSASLSNFKTRWLLLFFNHSIFFRLLPYLFRFSSLLGGCVDNLDCCQKRLEPKN